MRFELVSLSRGQSARINVTVDNPDALPTGNASITIAFDLYELVRSSLDRSSTTLRFGGRQSTQANLHGNDGAVAETTVPGDNLYACGIVIVNSRPQKLRRHSRFASPIEPSS